MLARLIFSILTIISIAWIIAGSYIQNQQTKQFQVEELFGPNDQRVIVINQFTEENFINDLDSGKIQWDIISKNAQKILSNIYYSVEQNHALIQTNEIVTEKTLRSLFQPNVFITKNSFTVGDYQGHFNHTNIYIYTEGIKTNISKWKLPNLDKNATANIINFDAHALSITDFYNRNIGKFIFESENTRYTTSAPINDKELFMHVLSNKITEYYFFKKENLNELDPSLTTQSWLDLCESGVVITTLNKQKGVYFDAKPNTTIHELSSSQTNTTDQIIAFEAKTESTIFKNRNTLYIANLDDHYVVSASKNFCEEAIANYKLGTVLQTNPSKMSHIYGNLPRKVHTRIISSEKQVATRYVKGQKLTFTRKRTESTAKKETIERVYDNKSPKHFNIGGEVKTLFTDQNGRIAIVNTDNTIHYFGLNGKILSLDNINEIILPNHFTEGLNGEQFLPIIQKNKASLYSPTGSVVFDLESKGNYYFTTMPYFSKLKGKEYLFIGGSDGNIYWYNAKNGKIERQIKVSSGNPIGKLTSWNSAGKMLIGAQVNQTFYIINSETGKQLRNFKLNNVIGSHAINGDLKTVVFDRNRIQIVNQKGGIINLTSLNGMTQVRAIDQNQSTYIAFDGKHRFIVFSASGEILCDRTLTNSTIDQFDATIGPNNTVIVACLDEINNSIQLINLTTEQVLNSDDIKGSTRVLIQAQGKNVFLYTFIDNILIRYDQ